MGEGEGGGGFEGINGQCTHHYSFFLSDADYWSGKSPSTQNGARSVLYVVSNRAETKMQ